LHPGGRRFLNGDGRRWKELPEDGDEILNIATGSSEFRTIFWKSWGKVDESGSIFVKILGLTSKL